MGFCLKVLRAEVNKGMNKNGGEQSILILYLYKLKILFEKFILKEIYHRKFLWIKNRRIIGQYFVITNKKKG